MKIAFFGLPLAALLLQQDGHDVGFALLSPVPAPGGRRLRRHLGGQRVLNADEAPADEVQRRLQQLRPHLIVSWYYTRLIPADWLHTAAQGALGVHPSLLPRHRGPNPFFWAIDSGDAVTGVSVHRLDEQYDRGAVLAARQVSIEQRDAWQLARALDRPSLQLLRETLSQMDRGHHPAVTPQDEASASWAPEPSAEQLRVDWSWPGERIARRIRALSPTPGLALEVRGLPFFATRVRQTKEILPALLPGEAALVRSNGQIRLAIASLDGALLIERATLPRRDQGEHDEQDEGVSCDGEGLAHALLQHAPEMLASVIELERA